MLTQCICINGFLVNSGLVCKRPAKSRRIKGCAGRKDLIRRPVKYVLQIMGHHICRIGNIHNNAGVTRHSDVLRNVLHNFYGLTQGIHPRLSLTHIRQRSCCHNQKLCILDVAVISCVNQCSLWQIHRGIIQVKSLCLSFLFININIDDFLCKSLGKQCIPCMGSHMSRSDNRDFSGMYFHASRLLNVCSF